MALVLAGLLALNVPSYPWLRARPEVSNRALLLALMLDVTALTAQLYFSGGAFEPLHRPLPRCRSPSPPCCSDVVFAWTIVALAALGFLLLTRFNLPLALPASGAPDLLTLNIFGTFVVLRARRGACSCSSSSASHATCATATRASQHSRQQAAEEDLIVRMGLLASGAAHELGTPLASVSVILSDWKRMPAIRNDPR